MRERGELGRIHHHMPLPARFLLMQIIDGGSQQLMVGIHWPKANPVTIGSTENLSGLTHAFRLTT